MHSCSWLFYTISPPNFPDVKFYILSSFFPQNFCRAVVNFSPKVDSTHSGDPIQWSNDQPSPGLSYITDFLWWLYKKATTSSNMNYYFQMKTGLAFWNNHPKDLCVNLTPERAGSMGPSRQRFDASQQISHRDSWQFKTRCQFHHHFISNFCALWFKLIFMVYGVEHRA